MKTQKEIEVQITDLSLKLHNAREFYAHAGEARQKPIFVNASKKTMDRLLGEIKSLKWVLGKE